MEKLYFMLYLMLFTVVLAPSSYGQANSVTFDFEGGSSEWDYEMRHNKGDYVLKTVSVGNKQHVATNLSFAGGAYVGTALGGYTSKVTFSIYDGSPFDFNSMDIKNYTATKTLKLTTNKGGTVSMTTGDGGVIKMTSPANDPNFKQITSFILETTDGQMRILFDNVKLDNITDLIAPKVNSVTSSSVNNKTYVAGEEIMIDLNLSEKVTVTGTPTLTLETGTTDRDATYVSGSGTTKLTFKYTVQTGDMTYQLNYTSTSAIALNGGSIKDRGANDLELLPPVDWRESLKSSNIAIDALAPTVNLVTSRNAERAHKVGEVITVRVEFSEKLVITGTPQLALQIGSTTRKIDYVSQDEYILFFNYTVQAGDVSSRLDYASANALTLNGGTIKDVMGNDAVLTLPSPGATNSLGNLRNISVDGAGPTVASVTSSKDNGTYKLGDVIGIQVNFSKNVLVIGSPQITLKIGSVNRAISYNTGSGTSVLTFNYTVQTGDISTRLDYASTTALALNGATIRDGAGNDALLTLPTPGQTNSLGNLKNITIDGTVPTVSSVTSPDENKTYKLGDEITIQVNFSENVTVTNTPQLTLRTGAVNRVVDYSSGSGTSTLTFKYTVQVGDSSADLDYFDHNALRLNGGTIKDAAGNAATLTLPAAGAVNSLGYNKAIVVNGELPKVVNVTSSSQSRSYRIGDDVLIWVDFSENVTITGTPQLTLRTGSTYRNINYVSGSGTSSIRFDYTVQLGDYTDDLDYVDINSLLLNGGTIKDRFGNNVLLTLPAPGAPGSLGANRDIKVAKIEPNANGVLFVSNGTFEYIENGTTWSTAIRELANALKIAKTQTNIKQIWVKTGTHYPKYSPADNNFGKDAGRDNAFALLSNVKVYGGFSGSETSIEGRNAANRTILSGDIGVGGNSTDNVYHVIVVSGNLGTATLDGFTITGGNANGAGDITINANQFSRDVAGGIYLHSSSPTFANLTISDNTAASNGGGMYQTNYSSPTLTNVTVTNNSASNGAGIYNLNSSSPILNNVTIQSNTALASGGGIYNLNSSAPKLTNVVLGGNKANVDGGGIYNANGSSPELTNVLLRGNKADGNGGGIYNKQNSPATLVNVTLSGNWANDNGGALYNDASNPKLYNSIVFGNSTGVFNASSTPAFYNSIIEGSFNGTDWVSTLGTNGGNNLDADPRFIDAPNYNTAPFTGGNYKLLASSPAINAGNNSYYAGLSATTKDLNGQLRVYDYVQNGRIDLGAFEYQSAVGASADNVLFVKKGATGNGSSWTNALGELADALKTVRTTPGIKQIWVAAGTYHPMYSPADNKFGVADGRNNAFLLAKDIKIYGGFAATESNTAERDTTTWAHRSILSGDIGVIGDNADNAYHVVLSVGDVGTATLNGFTIKDGNAGGGNEQTITVSTKLIMSKNHGGILTDASSPILSNLTITANTAQNVGGGIGITGGARPSISNTIINGNSALSGAAVYINATSPTFQNVIMSGNSAGYAGGAIYVNNASSAVFTNVTISGNKANTANMGGALHIQSSSTTVPFFYNSIIYGNNTGVSAQYTTVGAKYYNSIVQGSRGSGNWLSTTGVDGGNNLDVDPKFVTMPAHATAPFITGDFQLQATSPAINKGNNAHYTDLSATTADFAGKLRAYNFANGGAIDMGAYEYQGLLPQTINFAALADKTISSADFVISATASTGLPVTFVSSDPAIAQVYQDNGIWKVKIKGAGTVEITAVQAGDAAYEPKEEVQTLQIIDPALPVELFNYTAQIAASYAKLQWQTASEQNNKGFEIYRSGDDKNFVKIADITGKGNSNTLNVYSYVDQQPLNGNNYYKLVQVDNNGKSTELGVRSLGFNLSALAFNLYPNPTKNKVIVNFEAAKYTGFTLNSVDGRLLKSIPLKQQQSELEIDLSDYPTGVYFIRLMGARESIVKKVIKQ